MRSRKFHVLASLILALTFGFVAPGGMQAKDTKDNQTPYPSMAPLEQYLMDRDAEIVLARSAAPESISRDAKVLVLGRNGYETAVEGKNGFVCMVKRGWANTFDNPEYWNPKIRSPLCYNPPAVRSILPIDSMRTKMVLAGKSKAEIRESVKAGLARKELPALEPGAMCYMMSKNAHLNDKGNLAHIMFFTGAPDATALGAGLPGSPVLVFAADPEPIGGIIVGTGMWSDGTPAPVLHP